jgi:CRP-like cAMP-binding protein
MNSSRGFEVTGIDLFHGLPLLEEDKLILSQLTFVRKAYEAHTDIVKEGDESDRVFLVRKGWTALYRIALSGERQIVDFPIPGDLIGLNGGRGIVQSSFMAITAATVYETNSIALLSVVARSKRLTELLMREASRQRSILVEHLMNLGRRTALSRVAHLLIELEARLRAAGLGGPDGYECPLTQYDLADALGLTAIHVNRMLRELRQADLLHFHKGYVGVLNHKELAALAGFDPTYLTEDKRLRPH